MLNTFGGIFSGCHCHVTVATGAGCASIGDNFCANNFAVFGEDLFEVGGACLLWQTWDPQVTTVRRGFGWGGWRWRFCGWRWGCLWCVYNISMKIRTKFWLNFWFFFVCVCKILDEFNYLIFYGRLCSVFNFLPLQPVTHWLISYKYLTWFSGISILSDVLSLNTRIDEENRSGSGSDFTLNKYLKSKAQLNEATLTRFVRNFFFLDREWTTPRI